MYRKLLHSKFSVFVKQRCVYFIETLMKSFSLMERLFVILSVVCILLLNIVVICNDFKKFNRLLFVVDFETSVAGTCQVFYDVGNGYNEYDSYSIAIQDRNQQKCIFPLPQGITRSIRVDPINIPGIVKITKPRVENRYGDIIKTFPLYDFKPIEQINKINIQDDVLVIHTIKNANDPIIIIDNSLVENYISLDRYIKYITLRGWKILLFSLLLFIFLLFLILLFRRIKKRQILFFLCFVFIFYLFTASSSYNKPFHFDFKNNLGAVGGNYHGERAIGYYNALTDAFLAGQLNLLVNPVEEILALPDPYDPSANQLYRLHDVSFFNEKYFLYFGPVPALVFFVPFRLIFHVDLPQDFAISSLGFGGLIWFLLLLRFITKTFLPNTRFHFFLVAVICASFCNLIPFICRRPEVYEVAISSAYFFLMGAFYWLISGAFGNRVILWRLLLGSLFLGFAVGSRVYFVFAAVFLILICWKIEDKQYHYRLSNKFMMYINIFIPFVICMISLLAYNYFRFGSFFEVGSRYQLAGINMHNLRTFDLSFILPNLYFYFIQPCLLNFKFPFFHLVPFYPFKLPSGYLYAEKVAGVLTTMPFLNLLFLFPLFFRKISRFNHYLSLLVTFFIFIGLFFALFLSCAVGSATMRYIVDFESLLLLATFVFWFYLNSFFQSKRLIRLIINVFMIISIVYGCLFNIGISFTGYYDLLNRNNPEVYNAISSLFNL